MDSSKILEMRRAGYTWNEIDQMLLPPEKLVRGKMGNIISQAYKFAKKKGIDGAFTKVVIGAFTATQIVVPIRTFDPHKVEVKQQVEMFI